MRSIVYLIGAGPGAPDLITLRGYHCLQQADVVIYDHRVHADVLRYAPAQAERIDVGGGATDASAQDAICFLLAEKAREGKSVARLKRGDSFLFDHGGEEALFLHEQGIPFEVVPGVPSAIGAAAYAGIPDHLSGRAATRSRSSAATRTTGANARGSTGTTSPASAAPSSVTPARSSCPRCSTR